MTFGLLLGHSVESIFKFMNPNIFQALPVPSIDEIREILIRRVDQQKQAAGIVAGVIDPNGRRVAAYGKLAKGDPRTLDGDTIFEIGSITKVFTSLVLADMVNRKEVALDDPAAKYLPENVRMPERNGKSITLLDLSTHSSGLPPHFGGSGLSAQSEGLVPRKGRYLATSDEPFQATTRIQLAVNSDHSPEARERYFKRHTTFLDRKP
jgi:CubicO group peptidase (beta-lactamase class C family)